MSKPVDIRPGDVVKIQGVAKSVTVKHVKAGTVYTEEGFTFVIEQEEGSHV